LASGYSLNQRYDNIWVCNNVFSTATNGYALPNAFKTYWTQPVTNFHFDNNIIQNFTWLGEYFVYSSNFSGVSIQKNLHYNNSSNSITYGNGTPSGTINNLTPANPLFVSATDFHLQAASPAINSGIPVSLPTGSVDYERKTIGNPPEVGAYENGTSAPAPVAPVYQSAAIQSTTPSLLEMTYDLSLSTTSVPVASAFTVLANSVAITVNTVAIVGTKVQLTLASPVVSGNTITITYTKPSTNPIQTVSGGQAITVTNKTVTNNVGAATPGFLGSSVENATPSLLEMTYNMALANIVPAASSFKVTVNSAAFTVSSVAIAGAKVQLVLSTPLKFGDIVTITYTKPTANPLQTSTGGTAASLAAQSTVNNIINPTKTITSVTVAMTVSPNHVHKIINVVLAYTGLTADLTASITPSIIRITDLAGTLLLEKLLVTGTTSIKIPVNLASGIYKVTMLANGLEMASQKMVVYQR